MKTSFLCGMCGKRYSTERLNPVLCVKCIAKMPRHEAPVSDYEIASAIRNPRYRFEERVQDMMKKGNERKEAEKIIRRVIATKELPDDRPHLHFRDTGEAVFVCADIGFKVDLRDLNKVIGTNGENSPIDHLMDSQIAAIGHSMGLKTDPFVRELLIDPIRHLVQMVWYRDLRANVSYEHLEKNLKISLDRYTKALLEYKPSEPGSEPRKANGRARAPREASKSLLYMSKQYLVTQDAKNVASGREFDLLTAAKTLKKAFTFAELVVAAKDHVKTKQDFETIILRFLKELISHNAIREVA